MRRVWRLSLIHIYPKVIAVYLTGAPRPGTGPQDVALALIGATFRQGIVKNAVLELSLIHI